METGGTDASSYPRGLGSEDSFLSHGWIMSLGRLLVPAIAAARSLFVRSRTGKLDPDWPNQIGWQIFRCCESGEFSGQGLAVLSAPSAVAANEAGTQEYAGERANCRKLISAFRIRKSAVFAQSPGRLRYY